MGAVSHTAAAVASEEAPDGHGAAKPGAGVRDARSSSPVSFHAGTSSLSRKRTVWLAAAGVLLCFVAAALLIVTSIHRSPDWIVKAFWLPASTSPKPVLLCLPRPMVYRPSDKLFDAYAKAHPNEMATREARQDQVLPLLPTDVIHWGDLVPVRTSGPGIGGVIAAVNISKLLTQQDIRIELRFGEEASYAEMRDSPVVLVGGINTVWATELTSELNFVFDETHPQARPTFTKPWERNGYGRWRPGMGSSPATTA